MEVRKINYHQEKAALLKEINFLFQSPKLTEEQRARTVSELQEILKQLKKDLLS